MDGPTLHPDCDQIAASSDRAGALQRKPAPHPDGQDQASAAQREFERVVLPHLDAAHNLAYWLALDWSAAEEIVQASVVLALQRFPSFLGKNERGWLLQIVRGACFAALGRDRPKPTIPLPGSVLSTSVFLQVPKLEPDTRSRSAQRQDLVSPGVALASLPIELRECLILCELEDMSYKEIAQIVGVPVGSVMLRLWQARRAMTGRGGHAQTS